MTTIFGVNTEPEAKAAHRELYGALGYTRHFFSPTQRLSWGHGSLAGYVWGVGEVPVISFKNWNEGDVMALMAEAGGDFWLCYDHEPEARIARSASPGIEASKWVGAWHRLRSLRDAMPPLVASRCHLIPILSRWQHVRGGFDWQPLYGGIAAGDMVGVDSYAESAQAAHGQYTPVADLLNPVLDLATHLSLPWSVPEFGAHVAHGDDGTGHADYLRGVIAEAALSGAAWMSYWCNAKDGYHLDVPGQERGLAVWRTAVAATPL